MVKGSSSSSSVLPGFKGSPFSFAAFCVTVILISSPLQVMVIVAVRSAPVVFGASVMAIVYFPAASPWSGLMLIHATAAFVALALFSDMADVHAPPVTM